MVLSPREFVGRFCYLGIGIGPSIHAPGAFFAAYAFHFAKNAPAVVMLSKIRRLWATRR
jgi:hypothetical protein